MRCQLFQMNTRVFPTVITTHNTSRLQSFCFHVLCFFDAG
jgi:hypothetical protein